MVTEDDFTGGINQRNGRYAKPSAASAGYVCRDCGFTIRDSRKPHDCYLACREAVLKLRNFVSTNHGCTAEFASRISDMIHYT